MDTGKRVSSWLSALKRPGKQLTTKVTAAAGKITNFPSGVDKVWSDAELADYLREVAGELTARADRITPNPEFREVSDGKKDNS